MRPRIVLFGLAAALSSLLIVLGLADELLVDLLWFASLGYRSVFTDSTLAQLTIFGSSGWSHSRRYALAASSRSA